MGSRKAVTGAFSLRVSAPRGTHLAGVASQVVCAGGPVLAGVGGALVHLLLAVAAGVAGLAAAEVSVARVHTEP